jgi:hypothetical protein
MLQKLQVQRRAPGSGHRAAMDAALTNLFPVHEKRYFSSAME